MRENLKPSLLIVAVIGLLFLFARERPRDLEWVLSEEDWVLQEAQVYQTDIEAFGKQIADSLAALREAAYERELTRLGY